MPKKTFLSRLDPTTKQETALARQLEECCWLYNYLLEQRKTASEQTREGLMLSIPP